MKLAVMQPYLFPYYGYFQLIHSVDKFVLYDDANYIKQGYINRNSINVDGAERNFIVPVIGASSNKKIKDLLFSDDVKKSLAMIRQSYSKAPNYNKIYPIVEETFKTPNRSIVTVCQNGIESVCNYLDIKTEIIKSSELSYNRELTAAGKLIDMSLILNCSHYINNIGGKKLYDKGLFIDHGVELSFLKSSCINYESNGVCFESNLSIIDVLMWLDSEKIKKYLKEYELV
ncbi:WbqC family protein [Halomonas alkalisoli]|uniref:WbqC family protein n=1 Tax=Halomonas alkalisoli TaxID=2907158 RepID=UPI001F27BFD4|nr:WbqC family protein [Halomonas alkalisoli]MCE9683144.1 WbqC family protein [Halomonas alkalisoli]